MGSTAQLLDRHVVLDHVRLPTVGEAGITFLLYILYRACRWGIWAPLTSLLRRLQLAPDGGGWMGHQLSFNS